MRHREFRLLLPVVVKQGVLLNQQIQTKSSGFYVIAEVELLSWTDMHIRSQVEKSSLSACNFICIPLTPR